MGRRACCSKIWLNRGSWTASEDKILTDYIKLHGEGKWRQLPIKAGLMRCGKSCRLRWLNYLKPDIKRGNISSDEEDLIIRLHKLLGNRWSLIARRLPGRTDNEIKNYWNTRLVKKQNLRESAVRTKAAKCSPTHLKQNLSFPIYDHDHTSYLDSLSHFFNFTDSFDLKYYDELDDDSSTVTADDDRSTQGLSKDCLTDWMIPEIGFIMN